MANVRCPYCGSRAIFRMRRDSDYGGGQYYDAVNDETCYEGVGEFIPDVDVYHCKGCDCFFDADARYPTENVVPVSALQDAISNLESHIRWLTGNYKKRCQSVRLRIDKSADTDLASVVAREAPELVKASEEIEKYNEQVKLLWHIIEKNKSEIPTIFSDTSEEEDET